MPTVSNFVAPGTHFMEDNFSTDSCWGEDGFRMIQMLYIYCALFSIIITSVPPQIIGHEIPGLHSEGPKCFLTWLI